MEAQRRRSVSMRLAREPPQEDLNANTPFEIGDHDYPLRSDLMAPYMGRLQELAQSWDARVPNMRVTASPFFDGTPEFNWKPCSAHLGHGCCKRNATQESRAQRQNILNRFHLLDSVVKLGVPFRLYYMACGGMFNVRNRFVMLIHKLGNPKELVLSWVAAMPALPCTIDLPLSLGNFAIGHMLAWKHASGPVHFKEVHYEV